MGTLDGQQHGRNLPEKQGLVCTSALLSAEQQPEIRKVHRGGITEKYTTLCVLVPMDGRLHWSEV